jgi:hypothetical protein
MRQNWKSGMQHRPGLLASAAAERELIEAYAAYRDEMLVAASLAACLGARPASGARRGQARVKG